MNIFDIFYISIFIISILLLLSGAFFGGYRLALIIFILLAVMHILLRKLKFAWLRMCRDIEDTGEIKSCLATAETRLEEKSRVLADKIAETNIHRNITGAMTSTMELSQILRVILEAVVKILKHERAVLLLYDEKETCLQAQQAVGLSAKTLAGITMNLRNLENPFTRSLKEARPLIIEEAHQYREVVPFLEDEEKKFPDSIITIPLIAKDKVVGLVLVDHLWTKRPFKEEDLRNLLSYTQQAGVAVLNARAYQTEKNFHIVLKKEVNKARKELLDAQSLLIQSERLAALGEMAAVVAHEVKNPMASIRACAQAIEEGITSGRDLDAKYLHYIKREIDRLDKIVRSILLYSRPPDVRLIPYNLNILVEETVDFMSREFSNEKIKLDVDVHDSAPSVLIDPEQTKQVLINLFDNSIFFVKSKEKKIISVRLYVSGDRVVLSVEDTGGGIDKKMLPRIFEPFVTSKTQGTGLGLAICKKIIESQHGQIKVHNKPGVGVRMEILMPGVKKK